MGATARRAGSRTRDAASAENQHPKAGHSAAKAPKPPASISFSRKTFKMTLGLQGAGLPLAKERDVHGMGKPIYHCAGDAAERKAQRGGENRRGLINKAKLCRA